MTAEPTGAGTQPSPRANRRDEGILLIAGYHFMVAGLFLIATVILAFPTLLLGFIGLAEDPGTFIGMFAVGMIAIVTMVFCLVYLVIGYGVWTTRQWGRIAALALAVVSLFAMPIGTIAGGLTLWYLLKPEVAERFE